MTDEEKIQKLYTLPWQALYDTAIWLHIVEEDIKGKDKTEIINKLIINGIEETAIDNLVNDYIYGDRVSFTLWSFEHSLSQDEFDLFFTMKGKEEYIPVKDFRNLKINSVNKIDDRIELLYVYSKEYTYTDEEGKEASVWELHRGCLWIGLSETYLACISKHDKMTKCIIDFVTKIIHVQLTQMKMPKEAIERCTNPEAISRVVLQGMDGAKTAISRAGGITEAQEEEVKRIKDERMDTSGSYIAKVSDEKTATIKYNMSRGNIGIYKHLSSEELFSWTQKAIRIILEEVENLKGKPAEEIFKEMGIPLKWTSFDISLHTGLNWILTQIFVASNSENDYHVNIDKSVRLILEDTSLFYKVPKIYCSDCDSDEVPICKICNNPLGIDAFINHVCKCGAPLSYTCLERHNCQLEFKYWYFPKEKLIKQLDKQITAIYKDDSTNYRFCIMGELLYILYDNNTLQQETEIRFNDVAEFCSASKSSFSQEDTLRIKEKCSCACSNKNINKCLVTDEMQCLPKLFYNVISGFRPQPHGVTEYGDVSGQLTVGRSHYEMKGIIKSNTENKPLKAADDMLYTHLKSTSKAGEEMIRQFIEQGMNDSRCELVALIAPQYFDNGFKGTFRYLAKLCEKK